MVKFFIFIVLALILGCTTSLHEMKRVSYDKDDIKTISQKSGQELFISGNISQKTDIFLQKESYKYGQVWVIPRHDGFVLACAEGPGENNENISILSVLDVKNEPFRKIFSTKLDDILLHSATFFCHNEWCLIFIQLHMPSEPGFFGPVVLELHEGKVKEYKDFKYNSSIGVCTNEDCESEWIRADYPVMHNAKVFFGEEKYVIKFYSDTVLQSGVILPLGKKKYIEYELHHSFFK